MALLQLRDVSVSFGALRVLDCVSLDVRQGERVGLIGLNGSGKTTLLRLLAGTIDPDSGSVERQRRLRIGFMEQEPALAPEDNVHDAALAAFSDLIEMERRMREIEHEIASADGTRLHDLLGRLGSLQQRFEHEGGYECEKRVAAVLMGLGFTRNEFTRPVSSMSGGERSRIAFAKLLLREPDLLLLDEPTNHLDLDGIEWLENYLAKKYRGAVLLVSHDRTFLDRTVAGIVELERGCLIEYPGNYSKYAALKEQRRTEQQRRYDVQQAFVRKEEAFIRRYHAAQRSREAQGRQKRLARLDRVESPIRDKEMSVRFEPARQTGEICLRMEGLAKSYGEKVLFRDLEFDVYRGERVGVIGPNGSGKTTLLRIMMGTEHTDDGSVQRGSNVQFGYLEQHASDLTSDRTVLDEVWERQRRMDELEVRNVLGRFLFSGDDNVTKPMRDLSGGERTRVALACLMVEQPNVLLLDEPSNHLDIASRVALESALRAYPGTLIVVSHDRCLLNHVARKLIVLEDGRARIVHGNYEDYEQLKIAVPSVTPKSEEAAEPPPPAQKRPRPHISKNRLAQMEKDITRLERERERIAADLARPELYADASRARELPRLYRKICSELDTLYREWTQQELDGHG